MNHHVDSATFDDPVNYGWSVWFSHLYIGDDGQVRVTLTYTYKMDSGSENTTYLGVYDPDDGSLHPQPEYEAKNLPEVLDHIRDKLRELAEG
jgi:hypothetical protein